MTTTSSKCNAALTVVCDESGENSDVKVKCVHHASCGKGEVEAFVNSKEDMIEMVKRLATENLASRAPAVALQVFKLLEEN